MSTQPSDARAVVRRIFPKLTEAELDSAVMHLRQYFQIAAEIVARESLETLHSRIDKRIPGSTMEERSNDSLKT